MSRRTIDGSKRQATGTDQRDEVGPDKLEKAAETDEMAYRVVICTSRNYY